MYYSQSGEDKMLYEKYFKYYTLEGKKHYFEMGALDGVIYSNTKFYEDTLGWSGILVEPNPQQFCALVENRPNNYLLSCVCSDIKEPLDFNICVNIPAVCSLEMTKPKEFDNIYYNYSKMIKTKFIPIKLDTIISNSGLERIDLLVLDVEGHELNVLNSFSFKIPVVLWLIEALGTEEQNQKVKDIMDKNNMQFMEKCAHNNVFINRDYLKYFDKI